MYPTHTLTENPNLYQQNKENPETKPYTNPKIYRNIAKTLILTQILPQPQTLICTQIPLQPLTSNIAQTQWAGWLFKHQTGSRREVWGCSNPPATHSKQILPQTPNPNMYPNLNTHTHTLAVNTTAATSIHNSGNMSTQLGQSAHQNKPNNV